MEDIVEDLRATADDTDAVENASVARLLEKAADEIARLRLAIRRLAEQDATLSVVGGNVIVEMDATLTDAEREAVDTAEASLMRESTDLNTPLPVRQRLGAAVATLRGLLERTR